MKKIHRSIWALVLTFTMLLGTCTSAFAATSRAEEPEMKEPGIVTIRSGDNVNGKIQGVPSDTEGVTVYKGVPFAEPRWENCAGKRRRISQRRGMMCAFATNGATRRCSQKT